MIGLARTGPVRYPLRPENGYLPDIGEIEERITPRTKALIINNPSNPTGAVFPEETVRALVELARKHDLWLISDEIYEDLIFAGEHVPAARFDAERVITVSGVSKSYAMTGWRIGWAITNPELVALCGKIQEALVSCPPAVSQAAAEAAVRGPQDAVEEMRAAYQRRRDLVREILEPVGLLPTIPEGAFYAMVDLAWRGHPQPRSVAHAPRGGTRGGSARLDVWRRGGGDGPHLAGDGGRRPGRGLSAHRPLRGATRRTAARRDR